jgi:hypothetical protein
MKVTNGIKGLHKNTTAHSKVSAKINADVGLFCIHKQNSGFVTHDKP